MLRFQRDIYFLCLYNFVQFLTLICKDIDVHLLIVHLVNMKFKWWTVFMSFMFWRPLVNSGEYFLQIHTACMSFWMTKRQAISSDAFKACWELMRFQNKKNFEIIWTLFEIILFIHFYPLKKAPGQSQKHFMKNFTT